MNPISRISPVTDAEAAPLVRPDTLTDLADQITATPVPVPRRPAAGRRLLIGAPLITGLAVVSLIVSGLWHPGFPAVSPGPLSRPAAMVSDPPTMSAPSAPPVVRGQVLSFIRRGGYLDVIIRNPLADPNRYRAEFARRHLDISLKLIPVSPSIVGSVVSESQSAGSPNIIPVAPPKGCPVDDGGSACPAGVRIPADFHGQAFLEIGRAARPGEQYYSEGSAFAPGEAMHGMHASGRTVAQVVAELRRRQVSVAVFDVVPKKNADAYHAHAVPGDWYVTDAVPVALQQVMLFVSPAPES